MSDFDQELRDVFRAELSAALDGLATQLDRLGDENLDDPGSIFRESMRIAHNVKGAARVIGFEPVADLSHALEDVLGALAEVPDQSVADRLKVAIAELESLAEGTASPEDAQQWAGELRRLVPDVPAPPGTEDEPVDPLEGASESTPKSSAEESKQSPTDPVAEPGQQTMRVHVDRLDRMMAATGELLSAQDRQIARGRRLDDLANELVVLARALPSDAGLGMLGRVQELAGVCRDDREELRRMRYLSDEVRESMRRVRMIPLAALLPVWRKIVREAARDTGRSARLVAEIGDVEIDRTILDTIRDPLMHLLRNAVGHGIGTPEEREGAGKPATATVRISARLAGGSVVLEIADDGTGLDPARVVEKALQTGHLSPDDVEGLEPAEILDLVFLPGFSTAAVTDQVSGRGMGLDIVRSRLRDVGGTVAIRAQGDLGGASFDLTLPASLVSLRGLDVRCGDSIVILPIDAVERTTRVHAEDLKRVDGFTAISFGDGEPLRLRHLGRFLGLSSPGEVQGWLSIVLLRAGRRRLGLLVEEILGEGDHVTKRLPWSFGRVPGVGGATILGDGRVAPVVDVLDLFAQQDRGEGQQDQVRRAKPGRQPKILVVDDSITSRTLEKNILQAAGYDVTTGTDGIDGWKLLLNGDFDLLVTDIEMPRLDGLELTRKVRAEKRLKHLPVIIVSSLGSSSDLETGATAGADEYLVKHQFDQKSLLEAVARHVS